MGRTKGSKNKTKASVKTFETYYAGYFIMDSGLKINFDVSEEEGGDGFKQLFDSQFVFEDKDVIWLGETIGDFVRVKKIVGFYIYDYEVED